MAATRTNFLRHSAWIAITFLTAALPAAVQAEDEGVLLRYKFVPNSEVRFEVDDKRFLTIQKASTIEKTQNQSLSKRHYKVASVKNDGSAQLKMMIDHVHMKAQFGNEDPIVFDSTDPTKRPKQFASIMDSIGKPLITITVNNQGEVIHSSNAVDQQSDLASDAESFLIKLPAEAVKVGDQWSQEFKVSINVTKTIKKPIRLKRTYTVDALTPESAELSFTTVALTPVRDPEMKSRMIDMTPKGTINFDIANGVIKSRTMSVNNSVVGFMGQGSKLTAQSKRTENLISHNTNPVGPKR